MFWTQAESINRTGYHSWPSKFPIWSQTMNLLFAWTQPLNLGNAYRSMCFIPLNCRCVLPHKTYTMVTAVNQEHSREHWVCADQGPSHRWPKSQSVAGSEHWRLLLLLSGQNRRGTYLVEQADLCRCWLLEINYSHKNPCCWLDFSFIASSGAVCLNNYSLTSRT